MDPIEAIVLGLVQGLTEFFPVSSSGHLAMLQFLFGGRENAGLLFEVAVHVATLIAIIFFYRVRIFELGYGVLRRDPVAVDYLAKLVVATFPVAVVGFTLRDAIHRQFSNPVLVGSALLVTGFIVMSTRWTAVRSSRGNLGWGVALMIGCGQALAIIPGISRSGATVAMAVALGVAPVVAAEFSFLLGVIAISGAAILMIPGFGAAESEALLEIALGSLAALVSGLVAIWLFVRMLDRGLFHYWAAYCWIVGGSFLGWTLTR